MTKEEMIARLNGMGMEDDFMVLSTYLDIAGEAIINRLYPYAKDDEELTVPRKYQGLQVEICAYLVNKRGAEGQIRQKLVQTGFVEAVITLGDKIFYGTGLSPCLLVLR